MKKIFLILISLYSVSISLASNTLFKQANDLYLQEKYEDAILFYDSIQESGLESADLFYNIGNTYYKLQNWPQSILYFERAIKLDPKHEDARFNLNLTQLKIVDKIEAIPPLFFENWYNWFIQIFSMNGWAILCIIFLWLSFVVFWIKKLTDFRLIKNLFIILFVLSTLSFIFSNSNFKQIIQPKNAIILSSSVVVKSAPSYNSSDLFSLHAGSKVSVLDQIGDWIHISIVNGNKGWMLKENCKEI